MKPKRTTRPSDRRKALQRLSQQLAATGWISEGYVQARAAGAGPRYPWTRKLKGKTVNVALSKEQYEWLKQAIANWRAVQKILQEMQRLTRAELFATLPEPKRRKRLSPRVLGII